MTKPLHPTMIWQAKMFIFPQRTSRGCSNAYRYLFLLPQLAFPTTWQSHQNNLTGYYGITQKINKSPPSSLNFKGHNKSKQTCSLPWFQKEYDKLHRSIRKHISTKWCLRTLGSVRSRSLWLSEVTRGKTRTTVTQVLMWLHSFCP